MADIELLKRLAEACDIERCADEEERDRNLNEFYSVLEPEDVAALIAENERLRQIISDSATACGAAMSAECTVEFMGHLPAEIAGVLGQLRAELDAANRHWANESNNVRAAVAEIARLKAENERLQAEQQEKIAWEAAPGLGICRYVTEARYRKFAPNIQRHYRPYTGDAAELERAREDAERLDWLLHNVSDRALRAVGIILPANADHDLDRAAVDAAMGEGGRR